MLAKQSMLHTDVAGAFLPSIPGQQDSVLEGAGLPPLTHGAVRIPSVRHAVGEKTVVSSSRKLTAAYKAVSAVGWARLLYYTMNYM